MPSLHLPQNLARQIGRNIALLRQRRGLTQAKLAQQLGTSQSSIARMEAGKQNLTTQTISRINQVLGADITQPGQTHFPTIDVPNIRVNLKITGRQPLSGEVTIKNSKNAAVSLQYAALINQAKTILKGIPHIEEVHRNNEVLQSLGANVRWLNQNDLEIVPPKRIQLDKLNQTAASKTRSILLSLGALLHHLDCFTLPYPGGCKLGKRPIESHIYALQDLGVQVKIGPNNTLSVCKEKLHPAQIVMYEASDTATENAILAAAAISGTTTIKFASANYMVQDLCNFLGRLGVKIQGRGTTRLTVRGTSLIQKRVTYYLSEDPIEAMFFIALAATTNSEIVIRRAPIEFLEVELLKLKQMGWQFKLSKTYKSRNGITNLVDIQTFRSKLCAPLSKIHPQPYPGLNIDNLPFFVPIATQANGRTLIHDWVYENRALYYTELNKLGAEILLADPHRVYIHGPSRLRANEVICPEALRPGAIILIAMLAAEGTSILRNVYSINRGYEDLFNRLNHLGARIETFST